MRTYEKVNSILLTFFPSTTSDKLLDLRVKAWVGSGYMGSFSPGAAANMIALEENATSLILTYIMETEILLH